MNDLVSARPVSDNNFSSSEEAELASPAKSGEQSTNGEMGVNSEPPLIAIEQLADILEERQLPDQRLADSPIDFDERRTAIRRASDLNET